MLSVLQAQADPVTAEKAREKAAAFFNVQQTAGARRRAPAARQLRLAAQGRDDTYFIFNAPSDDGGYVVVSGDDATEEILGYSNSGTINPDDMPCGMKWLLDSYTDQIKFLRDNGITREQNSRKRNAVKKENEIQQYIIDEDRRCSFDQFTPYNDSCFVMNGRHCPTGCMATAMAGLMYAYQSPKASISTILGYTFRQDSQDYFVKGIPALTQIDWTNIESKYCVRVKDEKGNTIYDENDNPKVSVFNHITKEQKAAVATLMKIVGVSIKTSYSLNDSEAYLVDCSNALKQYFGYDNSYVERENYSREEWLEMLRDEILTRGPVMYRGTREYVENGETKYSGHGFLLEGFKGNYFDINFGWSGSRDDKYLLDVLDGDGQVLVYSLYADAILNVRPLQVEPEVTDIRLENGNLTDLTFIDNYLHGSITISNKGVGRSMKSIFLQLKDMETDIILERVIPKELFLYDSYTYKFSFKNLTIGHHYVLSALDVFGDEFYHSPELLCIESPTFADAEDDSGPKKLTRFEYWFDDNVGARRWATLTKSETVARGDINTDGLDDGVHRLNYRVQRDDGKYSAVSSSTFLKLTKEQENRLDYWLDDDLDSKQTLEIESGEDEQLLELDLSSASLGYHRLNMQIALKGCLTGSVISQGVIKLPTGYANELEYWFDNDIAHAQRLTGKRAEAGEAGFIYVNELDLSALSIGIHTLNMRAVSPSGLIKSSVFSQPVMKLPMGQATQLEYWFDNDIANAQRLTGKRAEAGEPGFIYVNELDLSALPIGIHNLNFRAVSPSGLIKSSIVSQPVMKLPMAQVGMLEYWFDGDIAHSHTISGSGDAMSLTGCLFTGDLDLSGIAPGHHRLYYRAKSSNGQTTSSIGSAAIMVKSQYGADGEATMASYTLVVDDELVSYGPLAARQDVTFSYVLDAKELPVGVHQLKATFWNSFGLSVTEQVPFQVVEDTGHRGDVNGDGSVDVADIATIIDVMAGNAAEYAARADVNGDGAADVADIASVIDIMAAMARAAATALE